MVDILEPFPDIEDVLRLLLQETPRLAAGGRVGVDFPPEMVTPFVRVERIGGPRTKLNDYPMVDFDFLDDTRGGAKSLSEEIDAFLLGYPHSVMVDTRKVVVDNLQVIRSPSRAEWDDSVRRYSATYQFSVRR